MTYDQELAKNYIEHHGKVLLAVAKKHGLSVVIENKPALPLAMGHFEPTIVVTEANASYRKPKDDDA